MLRPSYTDLQDVLNKNGENVITSRYTIVIAAAKRARQLIDRDRHELLTLNADADKPVSAAIQEIYEELVQIHQ